MKVKLHSPDGDTDFFDNIAGVLPGDAFVYNLLWQGISNVSRSNERKWLYAKKRQEADDI